MTLDNVINAPAGQPDIVNTAALINLRIGGRDKACYAFNLSFRFAETRSVGSISPQLAKIPLVFAAPA